jgi:leucyl/phenylalanyl-tRNA--protein transferase
MPLTFLTDRIWFPPVHEAMDDGLLAIGGDLTEERLLLAYRMGIFPWYNEDEIPMWWCPDPRFVLFPNELKVSKSMRQLLRQDTYSFRYDTSFEQVIERCRTIERPEQDGTWISEAVVEAYTNLHHNGYAHSAECWHNGELIGGLYGILLGKVFFGESMFSHNSNASKFAFIHWVAYLKTLNVHLIDCQIHTQHLESLGARMISRPHFVELLLKYT